MTEIEKFIVKDALPRNWTKKGIPIAQQEKNEFENTKASNNVDLAPHKVFLRYFLMMNFTFPCFSRNVAYSGHMSLPHRGMYYKQILMFLTVPRQIC